MVEDKDTNKIYEEDDDGFEDDDFEEKDKEIKQPQNFEAKKKEKSYSFTITKGKVWQILTFVFLGLLVISIFTGGFGYGKKSALKDITGQVVKEPTQGNKPNIANGINTVSAKDYIDDDPMLGNKNAKITIVEFSDYQCPFCAKFRTDTFDQLKSNYIDTGKVNFVYRDFPLSNIHQNAEKSAEASECANDQGKFWQYHDKLFSDQTTWTPIGVSKLKEYAKELGLDTTKFNECLDSGKKASEISKDTDDAVKAGARGTPYFIVGNTPLSGAQPYSAFKAAIDAQL